MWVFQLLNKSIRFGLILSPHNKVVFFLLLLISLGCKTLNAQSSPNDTLKKVSSDTLFSGDDESLDEKITYSAEDSIVAFPESGKVILYGKAKVVYGTMKMNAAFMEIDYKHNLVLAYGKKDSTGKNIGNPEFDDGAEPLRAEKIMYNLKSKRGKIYNALTKQGELLVIGNEIKKEALREYEIALSSQGALTVQESRAGYIAKTKNQNTKLTYIEGSMDHIPREDNYFDVKSDLFSAFMVRITEIAISGGLVGMMTPFNWMFLSSFEKLRNKILENFTLTNLVRPEFHAFFDSAFVALAISAE